VNKPNSLRAHLLAAVPELRHNPDRLLVFIDDGKLRSTAAPGLSFEYSYSLNLIFTDYAGHPDAIAIPLFAWVLEQQSELMTNLEKSKDAIQFEVDVLANDKVDLSITLPLTERVVVKRQEDGSLSVTHVAEPPLTAQQDATHMQVFVGNELLAEWDSPAGQGVDIESPHPGPANG